MNIEMTSFARIGAQARLQQLQAEREQILRVFPDLGRNGTSSGNGKVQARQARDGVKPRRKPMTAAEKRAVSERMRRYWAGRREAKAAQSKATEASTEAAPQSRAAGRKPAARKGATKKR